MNRGRSKIKTNSNRKHTAQLPFSASMQEEFMRFIEYHPPRRFNRNLRKMLLEYLMHESSLEDLHLQDLLYDLQGLFELFDALELEEGLKENDIYVKARAK